MYFRLIVDSNLVLCFTMPTQRMMSSLMLGLKRHGQSGTSKIVGGGML